MSEKPPVLTRDSRISALCAILSIVCSGSSFAQIPVHLEPRHPVVFENRALRVLNVNIEAGDTTLDHIHANDMAIVCISGCTIRTKPVGGTWGEWLTRMPGQFFVNSNAGQPTTNRHQAGDRLYHVVSVENLRQVDWSPAAVLSAPNATLATATRAFQIYDVHLGAGQQTKHVHSQPTVEIVIAGAALHESGRTSKRLDGPGDWAVSPAQEAHTITNRGASETYVVEVVVR